ncbi:MAG: glycosyltransferase family 2 protein [Thermoanaerobaculia bacterium]
MSLSVIIPCRNGERTVGAAIAATLAQSEPPVEILVVDDASTDGSAAAAERAGARVIRCETRRNAGGARNAGLEAARGDLVAFLDADVIPSREWLAGARRALDARPEVAGVGARILNGRSSRYGKLDYFMNHSEWIAGSSGERSSLPTMAVVFRRSAIEGLRFPETNSGEDTAFALSVLARGGRLWFEPSITVLHQHERLDWNAYWDKQVACGRTIFWTRSALDRPGRALVRFPVLLFLFPHLWLMLVRMARAGFFVDAVMLFPWFVAGEIARIRGFFDARRAGVGAWLATGSGKVAA